MVIYFNIRSYSLFVTNTQINILIIRLLDSDIVTPYTHISTLRGRTSRFDNGKLILSL